jgi:beta-glucosidase
VNGKYASENHHLLNEILRDEWGFDGLVMSDWGAVNDRVEGLKCGLDLEMPGDIGHNRQVIVDAVNNGTLSMEVLDRAVRRLLKIVKRGSELTKENTEKFDQHAAIAKKLSVEGAVLMKNTDRALPLDINKKYLVVGEMFENMRYQGAGSSLINPYKLTMPKDAFDAHGVKYDYEKGYDLFSFEANESLMNAAIEKAKGADTILFFGGLSEYAESEGFDRQTLSLPENQLQLIFELGKLGKKIIFVMYGGSAVDLSFDYYLSAILNMYLPGEEGGEATFDLLFGKENPSGKLAESWPKNYNDVPFASEFTKTTNDRYKESIFVGYRYYTSFNTKTKYPFGYGLSYTDFTYSDISVDRVDDTIRVKLKVTNYGKYDGADVVELYVSGPCTEVIKPVRELRGFKKVFLCAGDSKTVTIDIPLDRLKCYVDGKWQIEGGEYTFEICSDAENVVKSKKMFISGVDVRENDMYIQLYGGEKNDFLNMSDEEFDKLIGREIPSPEITRPYDLNTPMRSYTTAGGKFLYGLVTSAFKLIYNIEKMGKNTPDKQTKVKNAYFGWQTIKSMSLRSISYASEGLLSHKMACVLLDVANNKPGKAFARLFKPEKCVKLPD